MSSAEDKGMEEVMAIDVASLSSSSTATSDSESLSDVQEEPPVLYNGLVPEDEEDDEDVEEDVDREEDIKVASVASSTNQTLLYVNEIQDIQRSSGSASPLEMQEERSSEFEYPLSQRVYSNPPCKMSTVLQRQSRELWDQFDNIGTEMIVTRRGR